MDGIRVFCSAIACSLAAVQLIGCSSLSPTGTADSKTCSQNLDAAYAKLDYEKSKGYSGKVEWAKAEGLLGEGEG
jgi:hypothetical protein